MTALKSLLVFLPALALGLLVAWYFWPPAWRRAWPLLLSVSIPVGLGLSSLLYFGWSLLAGPARPGFLAVELVFLVTLAGLNWASSKRSIHPDTVPLLPQPAKPTKWSWALSLLLGLLAAAAGVYFLVYTRYTPNGSFDAYAIWNLKARFIFRNPANWQAAFSPLLSWEFHADYPLLLPMNTAMGWFQVGKESYYVPALQAALFTLAGGGLLWSAVQQIRGWGQAALAGMVLISTPLFVLVGVWQLADVPLAAMILATCILLSLHWLHPEQTRGLLTLAGLIAGLAAWTKNEGLLFLVLTSLLLLVFILRGKEERQQRMGDLLAYAQGLLLPLSALLIFKLVLAPSNDLVGSSRGLAELTSLLFDPQRWTTTLKLMAAEVGKFGHSVFSLWLLPLATLLLTSLRPLEDSHRKILRFWGIAFLLLLAGYFVTYLITPHPLVWHVEHSAERLLMHIYPAVLWLVFFVSRAPEEWTFVKNRSTNK